MPPPDDVNPLTHPTRVRLFGALRRLRRAATTSDLARGVAMHPNGVRRHLEQMAVAGLLERLRVRHGRGRPRDEWSIAPGANPGGASPEAYADLARWLARAMASDQANLRRVEGAGRELGREMVPGRVDDLAGALREALAALGFQPALERRADGRLHCELGNCPYRESVRENPALICTLHRGITKGLLERLAPGARLSSFEPRDPDRAGCVVEVAVAPV